MLKKQVLEINFEKRNLEKKLKARNVAISTKSGEKSFKGHNKFEILKISIFFLHFSIIYTFKNNIKIASGNLK